MSRLPLGNIKNNSYGSNSSYETALSTSFDKRNNMENKSIKKVKQEIESDSENMIENEISMLENNVSMLSVGSPRTPFKNRATSLQNQENQSKCETPGEKLLKKIKDEESKEMLRKFYPELFVKQEKEEEDEDPEYHKNKNKNLHRELSFEDYDDKENIPPSSQTKGVSIETIPNDWLNKKQEESTSSTRILPKRDPNFVPIWRRQEEQKKEKPSTRKNPYETLDSDSEDDLENYLKKLRQSPVKNAEPVVKELKKRFLVEDDYISEESDKSEDESDDDDEDYENSYGSDSDENMRKSYKQHKISSDNDEYFLESLSDKYSKKRHIDAENFMKKSAMRMTKSRDLLTDKLVEIFRRRCFPEIKDEEIKIIWNSRLRKSAGQCRNHRNGNSTIEISTTVCTTPERVRDTLVHEFCHAAVWIVDKLYKEGHGPGWKKWAQRCMKTFRSLPLVERCHNYEIEAKFLYICQNSECKQTIKRQSKSLDIEKKICGKCKSRFELYRFDRRKNEKVLVTSSKSSTNTMTSQSENLNGFALFVKKNYNQMKTEGIKHAQIMERLSQQYKKEKLTKIS